MPRSTFLPLALLFTFAAGACSDDSAEGADASATASTSADSESSESSVSNSSGESTSTTTGTSTGGEDSTTGESSSDSETSTGTGGETDGEPDGELPFAPELYTTDRTHSPITPFVAANLVAIANTAPQRRNDVFSKIGASSTVAKFFMHCFANDSKIDLDGRDLWGSIETFRADLEGANSFTRTSLCATNGWTATTAITPKGGQSPLQNEIDAANPRYAVVLYGTNDMYIGKVHTFGRSMLELVETMTDQGVIPILTAIQPNDKDAKIDAQVPLYNAVIRAIAQAHQIPFIDFHRELIKLPGHGLQNDGIHRKPFSQGACKLTPEGLLYGANVRNLLSLEALDRAGTALEMEEGIEPAKHQLAGLGSPEDPFVVPALPFGDLRDTSKQGVYEIDLYPGCESDQDESGAELYYRFELTEATSVHALVIDRAGVDIDLHLVDASQSGDGCIARADGELMLDLDPGVYYFVLDTFVSGGVEAAGEYLFVIEEASF